MRILLPLLLLSAWLLPAEPPAAKFELASVPMVSQAASRLDNAIAPRFRDTAAAVTIVLTMGASRYGMDLTRPADICFYSFGEKPAMRIVAHALPSVRNPRNHAGFWGLRFLARRKNGLIAFDSEGVKAPFPADPPGKNLKEGELLRADIQAEKIHKHFQFCSFNSGNVSSRLILKGLDDLLAEISTVNVIFSSGEQSVKLEMAFRPKPDSALLQWMAQPLPPQGKVEFFSGARTLAVLRLHPTGTLRQYGKKYVEQGRTDLPPILPEAANGFAAMTVLKSNQVSAARLTVGMDPAKSDAVRKEVRKLGYTPYPDWFQVRKDPMLLCSEKAGRLFFCFMDLPEYAALESLFKVQAYPGRIPDRPFVCLDLDHPDRPLAELRFEDRSMILTLQASDSWFASCTPLLEKPLLLPEKTVK